MASELALFERRKRRVRYQLKQKAGGRLRLSVFRSGKHMYAQIIDDAQGQTLVSASTLDKELRGKVKATSSITAAASVGELVAKRAVAQSIDKVVFDRGGFLYHGRIKALADAARAGGLQF